MVARSLCMTLLSVFAVSQASAGQAAPENEAESAYVAYYQGVQAAQICRDVVLTTAEHTTLESVIEYRLTGEIGPGRRLGLIEAAKDGMKTKIAEDGCDAQDVQAALGRYDELTKME